MLSLVVNQTCVDDLDDWVCFASSSSPVLSNSAFTHLPES